MSETPFVIQGGFEMRLQAAENRCRICIVLTVGGRFILRGIACRLSFFFAPLPCRLCAGLARQVRQWQPFLPVSFGAK